MHYDPNIFGLYLHMHMNTILCIKLCLFIYFFFFSVYFCVDDVKCNVSMLQLRAVPTAIELIIKINSAKPSVH